MLKFIKTLAVILLFAPALAHAGNISISASADKQTVALNDYLVYTVTVRGDSTDLPDPKLGNINGFKLYGSGTSRSMSFVNGAVNMSVSHTYNLVPQTAGKFTIPPATAVYNGNTYSSQPIDIEVTAYKSSQSVNASASNSNSAGSVQKQKSASAPSQEGGGKAFVKASVSKATAYVNEKITYKFSFYTNVGLLSNPAYQPPDFSGFFNDGTTPFNRHETIDGKDYQVSGLEYALYPVDSGKKTISSAKVSIAVADVPDADDFDTLFSNMMAGMGMGRRQVVNLQTDPVTVNVIPLPEEGRPDGFNGAVGDFKISASADKNEVKTGDAVTISLKVSGRGNMKSVNAVDFDLGSSFRKYDTIVANVSDGLKEFQTIVVPLMPGEKIIPKIRLYYFNPDSKKYEFSETKEIALKVSGNPVVEDSAAAPERQARIKNDIRYNKDIASVCLYSGPLPADKKYYFMFVPFALLLGLSYFYKRRRDKMAFDPVFKIKREARSGLEKSLAKAQKDMSSGASREFYDSLYEALTDAASARTGTGCGSLNAAQICEKLE
ncbi:MAG: BatD family protein, partial [Endomicrobia bacterium]|nr:BatD family protein [Endomicrobiia bacterium]